MTATVATVSQLTCQFNSRGTSEIRSSNRVTAKPGDRQADGQRGGCDTAEHAKRTVLLSAPLLHYVMTLPT